MILSAFNLLNYLLLRKGSFLEADVAGLKNLDIDNPYNTILKVELRNATSYIFKQPKFLTSGATWQIIKENQFYEKYSKKEILKDFMAEKIDFDETYNILVLSALKPFEIPKIKLADMDSINEAIISFAQKSGNFIGGFHQKLRINVSINLGTKSFIRDYINPFLPPYRVFFNSLRKGYQNAEYLDENVFKSLDNIEIPIYKNLLYDFIWQDKINDPLNEFAISWSKTDRYLIHGDLKISNLFQDNDNNLKLIDFESVSKGDHAWDIIYFIDSILTSPRFSHGVAYQHRHLFFHYCLKTYYDKYMIFANIKSLENRFLERVLKFWVIKKLMNMMSSQEGSNDLEIDLSIIEKIITDTDDCVNAILDPDSHQTVIQLLFDNSIKNLK